jgi:hypothetical protein
VNVNPRIEVLVELVERYERELAHAWVDGMSIHRLKRERLMKLKLFHDGKSATVTSEAAAKRLAREWLGVKRLTETPTHDGWQYWDAGDPDEGGLHVTVKVL